MKQGYVPDWPTYTEKDIEGRNILIDGLCAKIQPLAREVFESALKRRYSEEPFSGIDVDLDLLIGEEIEKSISYGETEFAEKLKAAKDQTSDVPDENNDVFNENYWFNRIKDLTRNVAGFWFNYELDENKIAGNEEKKVKYFNLIVSRFGLNEEEAATFLSKLYDLMR